MIFDTVTRLWSELHEYRDKNYDLDAKACIVRGWIATLGYELEHLQLVDSDGKFDVSMIRQLVLFTYNYSIKSVEDGCAKLTYTNSDGKFDITTNCLFGEDRPGHLHMYSGKLIFKSYRGKERALKIDYIGKDKFTLEGLEPAHCVKYVYKYDNGVVSSDLTGAIGTNDAAYAIKRLIRMMILIVLSSVNASDVILDSLYQVIKYGR